MPVMYNLRSSQRKKAISDSNCYLKKYLQNTPPEAFSPKVCLERLKLVDCNNIHNSRFLLDKNRIIIRQEKPKKSNKMLVLKCILSIFLLTLCLMYYKDNMPLCGITIPKKIDHYQSLIKSYVFDTVRVQDYLKLLNYKKQHIYQKSAKTILEVPKKESLSKPTDSFDVKKLVESEILEFKNVNEFQNWTKTSKSFIEQQCKVTKDDLKTFFEESNLTDFALESLGAKIVTVFDTEPYGKKTVRFLNFDIWSPLNHFLMKHLKYFSVNEANSILKPWKKPGDCWAFRGFHGRVQIELSEKIFITAITVDHIPKEIALDGNIKSAPKKFSVMGIEELGTVKAGKNLGSYEYKSTGPASQTFLVESKPTTPFRWIEVNIESNHGNINFTCVYKIRVHGHV